MLGIASFIVVVIFAVIFFGLSVLGSGACSDVLLFSLVRLSAPDDVELKLHISIMTKMQKSHHVVSMYFFGITRG